MRKSAVLAIISLAAFMAILFTPYGTNYWIWFLIIGLVFGIIWFIMRR